MLFLRSDTEAIVSAVMPVCAFTELVHQVVIFLHVVKFSAKQLFAKFGKVKPSQKYQPFTILQIGPLSGDF